VAWDESATFNLRAFTIERGQAADGGDDYSRHYPENPPTGFIPIDKLKIDSTLAFEIAEKEARRARMGFNSLNYRLAAMEYATEPVWTLDLVDADDNLAGKVFLSGETGEVLRTLFIYRNDPLNFRIVDSAAPRTETDPSAPVPAPAPTTELTPAPMAPSTDPQIIIGTSPPSDPALPPMPNLTPDPSSGLSDTPAPPSTTVPPPPPLSPMPSPPSTRGGDRVIPPPPIPLEP
jgi:hypothetical protein